uniref:Uncharacterized protein n=1 Tax=Strongyloides venezuelensis TaxID=75913 RepID=A0A0K0FJ15_STRVS
MIPNGNDKFIRYIKSKSKNKFLIPYYNTEHTNINVQQSSIEIQEIKMYSKDEVDINSFKNNISIKKFGLKKTN